jgi:hypothetical protein
VVPSSWFTMAIDSERVTRRSADPLNIRPGTPRLDIRRYFYSQRVVDSWNSVCECLQKCLQTAQRCYACTRLIDFLDWCEARAEATLANNISIEDPPGPTEINHQVIQVSKYFISVNYATLWSGSRRAEPLWSRIRNTEKPVLWIRIRMFLGLPDLVP